MRFASSRNLRTFQDSVHKGGARKWERDAYKRRDMLYGEKEENRFGVRKETLSVQFASNETSLLYNGECERPLNLPMVGCFFLRVRNDCRWLLRINIGYRRIMYHLSRKMYTIRSWIVFRRKIFKCTITRRNIIVGLFTDGDDLICVLYMITYS